MGDAYSVRPNASHTRYLQSSPPDTMTSPRGDQSTASTAPSCAFHRIVLRPPGSADFTYRSLPHPAATASHEGDHEMAWMACWSCSSTARSMPFLPHVFSAPSSPHVASAVPSGFHRRETHAPRCASGTCRSTRPPLVRIRKDPSEKEHANTSLPPVDPPPLPAGNQCMSVTYPSRSHTWDFGAGNATSSEEERQRGREETRGCVDCGGGGNGRFAPFRPRRRLCPIG